METIYLVSDGNLILGFLNEEQYKKLLEEDKIEFYDNNEDLPMFWDFTRELYLSISKANQLENI